MATPKLVQCTCCGSEVTCPQFYNGKPYGYTCIKKVAPAQKRVKTEYVVADEFAIQQVEGFAKWDFVGRVEGFKIVRTYGYSETKFFDQVYVCDGQAFIPKELLVAK